MNSIQIKSEEETTLKEMVMCVLCEMVLCEPITLPCDCHACNEHLFDDRFARNGQVTCPSCQTNHTIPKEGFRTANKVIKNIINNDTHLSVADKAAKDEMETIIEVSRQLNVQLQEFLRGFDLITFNCFQELRRNIDLHREQLKVDICKKIDEYSLEILEKTQVDEAAFNATVNAIRISRIDFDAEEKKIKNEFRKLKICSESLAHLKEEHAQQLRAIETKLSNVEMIQEKIKSCSFTPSLNSFPSASLFGNLSFNVDPKIVSSSDDKTIKFWDIKKNQCLMTLNGHTDLVWSMEKVSKSQVLTGSEDKHIKLWDLDKGVCLKTFRGHTTSVSSLKMLTESTFASGASGDIKIWHLGATKCLQTLKGHNSFVKSFELLSNGSIVSCSQDRTIKV